MHIKPLSIVLSLSLLATTITLAQAPGITDSVSALFAKFMQSDMDQSAVLLTNRNIYLAGEKIWFKAYGIKTNDGRLDPTVKNLFADLVNEKDSVIKQLVLDNAGLRTEGAFDLSLSMPTGFYWIRCYTANQLQNKTSIFLHPVFIINKQLHDEALYARKFDNNFARNTLSPIVHFYAERLTALPGIISTGVIEIRDGNDNPLSIAGYLLNNKDSLITNFKTNTLGLARLTFLNDPAEIYTAVFHLSDKVIRYKLPAANNTSIQLSVTNQTTKTIKAFVTLEDSVSADTHTTILAVHQDSLYWAAVGMGNYGITIPIDNFPGGISRLLLFDGNKNLVSVRKIYIPKENIDLEIKPDKKKYSARENAQMHVKVRGAKGKPLVSALNVAVEDEWISQVSDSMEANILPPSDEFLLSSWLDRYQSKYSADDIDLLMATRKSASQADVDPNLAGKGEYNDIKKLQNLTGKIINRKGDGISNRIVNAMAKNSRQFFMDVDTTDHDGNFSVLIPQGFDSLRLSLQVTDKNLVQMPSDSIKIAGFHYPNFSTPESIKQHFTAGNFASLTLLKKYHVDTTITFAGKGWLAPVTVKTKRKVESSYDTRRLNPISQILTNDKIRYAVGPEGLVNAVRMVPGVAIYNGDFVIFGPSNDLYGHTRRPLLVIDGVPMPDRLSAISYLTSGVNPADIDFIEVLRGGEAAQYGSRGGGGVISINTKRGPDETDYNKTNLRLFTPVTYHVCPSFEMPDYSDQQIKNNPAPDSRTAIYWNGNIITNTDGEADINFYTGDNSTNYTVTVTALTASGELVFKRVVIANKIKSK